jgi:biotin operon repressor
MAEGGKGSEFIEFRMSVFPPESEETMAFGEESVSIGSPRPARLAILYLILAGGAVQTAQALAFATGASTRTIYRDLASLRAAGLSIQGTPKLGYELTEAPELTPLFLSRAERTALAGVAPAALRAKLRAL